MFKKRIISFVVLFVVMAVVSGCQKSIGVVNEDQSYKNKAEEKKLSDNPFVVEPMDKSNWQTYHNDHFGFDMKYPENWTIKEDVLNKDSEEESINKRADEFWSTVFNSHIMVDGSPHLVYLFFSKAHESYLKDYPDHYNETTKLYANKRYSPYVNEWYAQNNDFVLSIEKIIQPGEGLEWVPPITKQENDYISIIFDNMIQTIKFPDPSK